MVAARLTTRIHHEQISNDLLDEFLRQRKFQKSFCRKLINLARQRRVKWEQRCLAVLMTEHLILKLKPDDLNAFDWLFDELNLKTADALKPSLLKDGYSTVEPRRFINEFQQRLARLDRVHRRIRGTDTAAAALREFVAVSRNECKLTLARYLFTPEEVVDRIVKEIKTTDGVKDVDVMQPPFIEAETTRALQRLPDYEARILRLLCAGQKTYWVGDKTSQRINSLVEYPLTTVVLVVKPPGSDIEFELKRAGRRGNNPLNVVFRRGGNRVPVPHRLDGGSMQWLLRYEQKAAAKFSTIYRLVHGSEAPLPGYVSRTTLFSIPARHGPVALYRYFTDRHAFGERGFDDMRGAMKDGTAALVKEEGENLPAVAGEMGLTAEFLSHVAPAQSIMTGTSSFRIDKLGLYLSAFGAQTYFNDWLRVDFTKADAKQFADTLLEEVLGVYEPPDVALVDYGGYVEAAFAVPGNRARADEIFLEFVREIATVWGTLLGARGQSRGESFVARNVGLRNVWEQGRWKVKLIFMDHDALSLPDLEIGHFFAQGTMPAMLLDERHLWGRANPALFPTSIVGYLMSIYRISGELETRAQALAQTELKAAYDKTHQAMLNDRRLRAFFSDIFMSRLFDWDEFVRGYLGGQAQDAKWKKKMKKLFAEKGYEKDTFDYYVEAADKSRGFLDRNSFLFHPQITQID
ncbi:MAG TPA: hypothetical protein VE931_06040 [Pyrinomonadaceae bacterium]|nr:hypothetical protein [Pyrinomonadaceae bacterium]